MLEASNFHYEAQAVEKSGKSSVTLKDWEGNNIAVIDVEDIWSPDKGVESRDVYGGDPVATFGL